MFYRYPCEPECLQRQIHQVYTVLTYSMVLMKLCKKVPSYQGRRERGGFNMVGSLQKYNFSRRRCAPIWRVRFVRALAQLIVGLGCGPRRDLPHRLGDSLVPQLAGCCLLRDCAIVHDHQFSSTASDTATLVVRSYRQRTCLPCVHCILCW